MVEHEVMLFSKHNSFMMCIFVLKLITYLNLHYKLCHFTSLSSLLPGCIKIVEIDKGLLSLVCQGH